MNRIDSLWQKLERAEEHVRDLGREMTVFLESCPYSVAVKDDEESGKRVYYALNVGDVPSRISAIAGDAIHNLRSVLDHLAWHLVDVAGNTPTFSTGFPVSFNATKYPDERKVKVKGMRQDAIELIDALKPYKGGNDEVWRLHRLDIIDKHRALIAAGMAVLGQSIIPSLREQFTKNWIERNPGAPVPDFRQPLGRPAFRGKMLKSGDVLLDLPPFLTQPVKTQNPFKEN
jgi:hypothetical protein